MAAASFLVPATPGAETNAVPATNAFPDLTSPAPNPPARAKAKKKKTPAPAASAKTSRTDSAPQPPGEGTTVISPAENALVKQDHINVRGQPGLIGEVVTRLRKGEQVTLLEEIHRKKNKPDEPAYWFKIAMPTNTPVWVNAEFIDAGEKVVKARKLNVRAGPGENYSVVGRLEKGAPIREIRRVNNWVEIETPDKTYAYVAAEFVARQAGLPATPTPTPAVRATEVATVPAEKTNAVAALPPAGLPANPATKPGEAALPVVGDAPPAPPQETVVKRVVTREGIVRRAPSIQSPSDFALENPETGKVMNYVHNEKHPEYQLNFYKGFRVIITGEEMIDSRWPNTPVLTLETLDLP